MKRSTSLMGQESRAKAVWSIPDKGKQKAGRGWGTGEKEGRDVLERRFRSAK